MKARDVGIGAFEKVGDAARGKILVINDDAHDLETSSSSIRREGFEVRAFASFPDGLSCLESEHFDMVMVKLREVPSLKDEEFWSVRSKSAVGGLSRIWQAVSTGVATVMWCTWDQWKN